MCLSSFAVFPLSLFVPFISSPFPARFIGCGLRMRQKIKEWDEAN
jgi:hypothetical protein